ncbi:hypothetical protein PT974_02870 [Cladobotryum mycophilum]|uniref:Uncharacterized protein n=1 Tax=Cladobotryum mycophilum TaxID=491253 RepID=A0ABR0SZH8_9HYPO
MDTSDQNSFLGPFQQEAQGNLPVSESAHNTPYSSSKDTDNAMIIDECFLEASFSNIHLNERYDEVSVGIHTIEINNRNYSRYCESGEICDENNHNIGTFQPIDKRHTNSEEVVARVWERLEPKLVYAPVSLHKASVLNVGSGSGHWARAFARRYARDNVEVVGTDAAVISELTCENLEFFYEDIAVPPWSSDSSTIRYVFIQQPYFDLICLEILQEIHRVLEPGGYFELAHLEFRPGLKHTAWCGFNETVRKMEEHYGRPFSATNIAWMMERIGFENIRLWESKFPITQDERKQLDIPCIIDKHLRVCGWPDSHIGIQEVIMKRELEALDPVPIMAIRVWGMKPLQS